MNIQEWFPLGWTSLTRDSGVSPTWQLKSINSWVFSLLYGPTLTTGKTIALTTWTFVSKVMSLLFNILCHSFSFKEQVSFNFMAAVTICSDFGAPQNKVCHCFHCFPTHLPWSDGNECRDLLFWMLSFKPAFSLSSFTFLKKLFKSSSLSAINVVSSAYLRLLMFLLAMMIPGMLHPVQHFTWCTLHIS